MGRRIFLDTNVWIGGLSTRTGKASATLRQLILNGAVRPVVCPRQIRQGLIVIGQDERLDPMRHGYAFVFLLHLLLIEQSRADFVPDPDKLQVLAARARIADPDDAWWLALAEREGVDIVSADLHLHEARTTQQVWTPEAFVADIQRTLLQSEQP